jgi:anaerobic ribonucleoside-triphosphate reductase activating protein
VVTGRYEQGIRNTSLQWRGSENQSVHFVGDRYSKELIDEGNYIEIHIDGSGLLEAFGYCEKPFIDGLSDTIG